MQNIILFQGDSITDAARSRENDSNMGVGYPTMIKAELGYERPGKYIWYNRGISGNRVVDLYARIKEDIINIKPDILSILIGVNDVLREYESQSGTEAEKFYKVYSMLVEEIKCARPDVKIFILEPFVLKGTATENNWIEFRGEVEKRAEMARAVAQKFQVPFIKLQHKFDEAEKTAPSGYWLIDGVHPTAMGHELIKREWLSVFRKSEAE